MTPLLATPSATDTPERDLVSRAQAGEMSAFEELAGAHADRLYAVLVRLIGDRGEAEDVAQETLLRAWRGIRRFQGRSMFFTWLYRIAVNEANRSLEKRARAGISVPVDDHALQLPAPAHEGPASQAEREELRSRLDSAIAGLRPTDRVALVLRDVEGLSTREAAEIVGIGEAAFKSRLHQARLKVRAAIGDVALLAPAV